MHGFLGTKATLLSDVNLVLELVIIAIVLAGWRYGRAHRGWQHHWTMLVTVAVFLAFFLIYMLRRTLEPPVTFPTRDTLYFAVYLPVVIVHSAVSTVAFLLGTFVSVQGLRKGVRNSAKRAYALKAGYRPRHARLGIISTWCYVLSAVSGIAVYLLLYLR
ncbi:MAG TPA: DUF420 domain-containing protein [Coriobacteriia bacterium]|jgi:uncharacterized membrane protein YozB (DUF420 family)